MSKLTIFSTTEQCKKMLKFVMDVTHPIETDYSGKNQRGTELSIKKIEPLLVLTLRTDNLLYMGNTIAAY